MNHNLSIKPWYSTNFRVTLLIFTFLFYALSAQAGFDDGDSNISIHQFSGLITIEKGTVITVLAETPVTVINEKRERVSIRMKKARVIRINQDIQGPASKLPELLADAGSLHPDEICLTITQPPAGKQALTKRDRTGVKQTARVKESVLAASEPSSMIFWARPWSPFENPILSKTGEPFLVIVSKILFPPPPEEAFGSLHEQTFSLPVSQDRILLVALLIQDSRAPPSSIC